jgi:hypothetical protein
MKYIFPTPFDFATLNDLRKQYGEAKMEPTIKTLYTIIDSTDYNKYYLNDATFFTALEDAMKTAKEQQKYGFIDDYHINGCKYNETFRLMDFSSWWRVLYDPGSLRYKCLDLIAFSEGDSQWEIDGVLPRELKEEIIKMKEK